MARCSCWWGVLKRVALGVHAAASRQLVALAHCATSSTTFSYRHAYRTAYGRSTDTIAQLQVVASSVASGCKLSCTGPPTSSTHFDFVFHCFNQCNDTVLSSILSCYEYLSLSWLSITVIFGPRGGDAWPKDRIDDSTVSVSLQAGTKSEGGRLR